MGSGLSDSRSRLAHFGVWAVTFGPENLGRLVERLEIHTMPESPESQHPADALSK